MGKVMFSINKKSVFPVAIFVFISGITMSYISKINDEKIILEYQGKFSVGDDIALVKAYLDKKRIGYSIEKSENFTVLDRKYKDKGYHSVLLFNARKGQEGIASIVGKSDLLVEVGFDSQGRVVEVISDKINTFL